jgi:hypothetical protein
LRQIGFQPDGEFGSAGGIEGYDFLKSPGIRDTFIHSLTISAPASSRSEQPGPPLPDYDVLRKPPWAAALHYPAIQSYNPILTSVPRCCMGITYAVVCGFA